MQTGSAILQEDLERICSVSFVPWDHLKGKTVLITGASGLIGKCLTRALWAYSRHKGLDVKLVLLARNTQRLDSDIQAFVSGGEIEFLAADIRDEIKYNGHVDFVVHAASITDSRTMVERPVEVIMTNVLGTRNALELAKRKEVQSAVFLSSMEAFGFSTEEKLLKEDDVQYLNPLAVRSSYPESKRLCECMCAAYASEYGVPVKIVRLAQTFGAGTRIDDNRVFAEFARCALRGEDIVLLTDGASKRPYLDSMDAVGAILTVLLKGCGGEAYTAANKDTYCSVREMADMVAHRIAHDRICVRISAEENAGRKFPPPHRLKLDTGKLEKLGWKPSSGLEEMYLHMMDEWGAEKIR